MQPIDRRSLLKGGACGFGFLALADLCAREASALAPRRPHFAPRANRVIFLHMMGAPSQQDTFDHKPRLARDPWRKKFKQHGESGLWVSEVYPHLARHADELCVLKGMTTDVPNHKTSTLMLHTGSGSLIRPSVGAWVLYGLGSDSADLPGYVAMNMPHGEGGAANYGSAFLPATYQGMAVGGTKHRIGPGDIKYVRNPRQTPAEQRGRLDFARRLNLRRRRRDVHNPELDGLIESFERAFRMQSALPSLMDFRDEPRHVLEMYGVGDTRPFKTYRNRNDTVDTFARQCLLARRLAEAGVRFIEVTDSYWDHHTNQSRGLAARGRATDRPIAALLTDLKRRGLLEDTLVVWGGEFGRKAGGAARDGSEHNEKGFTMWLAGGGVRGGFTYGRTDDEKGEVAVEGRMHIHDLHATILYLLGLDHERLTYRYAGRDFRLTDVHGRVPREILD